jgi:4-carboxymuconolactone decarboxylase
MSRLKIIPPEQMTPAQHAAYAEAVAAGTPNGTTGGPYTAWIRTPEFMRLHRETGHYLQHNSLSPRVRQIVVLRTIKYWGAKFPWSVQVRASLKVGLEQVLIDALEHGETPALASAQEAGALKFSTELLETKRVSETTYKETLALFGEAGVVDLVSTIGSFCLTSLTAIAFDIDPPKD